MSTITTTAPSFEAPRTSGRRILVAGAVVAGLVVAGAVAIPRLTAQTAAPSYPAVTPHDAVEHRLDTSRAAAAGEAARLQSAKVQRQLDLDAKHIAAVAATQAYLPMEFQPALEPGFTRTYVGSELQTVEVPRMVERSVIAEQVGGRHESYAWTPNHLSSVAKQQTGQQPHFQYTPPRTNQRYNGSTLETVPLTSAAKVQAPYIPRGYPGVARTSSTTTQEQVGGRHESYSWTPSTAKHLTWTDPWVPPYDNPEWVPFIKAHYFHPVTTRSTPTHEYR